MAPTAPETLLERLSDANYIDFTKNQPKRLHLRPFRKNRLEHRAYMFKIHDCRLPKIKVGPGKPLMY